MRTLLQEAKISQAFWPQDFHAGSTHIQSNLNPAMQNSYLQYLNYNNCKGSRVLIRIPLRLQVVSTSGENPVSSGEFMYNPSKPCDNPQNLNHSAT